MHVAFVDILTVRPSLNFLSLWYSEVRLKFLGDDRWQELYPLSRLFGFLLPLRCLCKTIWYYNRQYLPFLKGLSCMLRILSNCYFSWRTLKDVNNIFVSDFSFLTFLRYYHHIAQHYSQVQEYKVFVTTISADIFLSSMTHFFLPVLVLS